MVNSFGLLLTARERPTEGNLPQRPSQEDYAGLVSALTEAGMTEAQLNAIIAADPADPNYCEGGIRYTEGLIAYEGRNAEGMRFDVVQGMLSAI
jgi:hypothetical protein